MDAALRWLASAEGTFSEPAATQSAGFDARIGARGDGAAPVRSLYCQANQRKPQGWRSGSPATLAGPVKVQFEMARIASTAGAPRKTPCCLAYPEGILDAAPVGLFPAGAPFSGPEATQWLASMPGAGGIFES